MLTKLVELLLQVIDENERLINVDERLTALCRVTDLWPCHFLAHLASLGWASRLRVSPWWCDVVTRDPAASRRWVALQFLMLIRTLDSSAWGGNHACTLWRDVAPWTRRRSSLPPILAEGGAAAGPLALHFGWPCLRLLRTLSYWLLQITIELRALLDLLFLGVLRLRLLDFLMLRLAGCSRFGLLLLFDRLF